MRISPHPQRSPEWFAEKVGVFSASNMSDLLATTRGGVPSTLRANYITQIAVERLTRVREDGYQNAAMQRGTLLEPDARVAYERLRGVLVYEIGFALHDLYDFVGASMDGLVGDAGLFEAKCPIAMAKHWDALQNGSHAREYAAQIDTQLWIGNREWLDAVSFDPRFPEGLQLAITRVYRDAKKDERIEDAVLAAEAEVRAMIKDMTSMQKSLQGE